MTTLNVFDWIFAYYMSYDNNLSSCGERILKDMGAGIISPRIAVLIQADFRGAENMKRIILRNIGGEVHREELTLDNSDSADENEYKKYLDWILAEWNTKNYCVVFLNHGETVNNMCFDESSEKWLNAQKVGDITASFNHRTGGKVRLLFLQQCGRGSLDNLCNFINSAEYIMSSPFTVGAPNTYYAKLLESVSNDLDKSGSDIAKIIMQEDQDYRLYTLVNGKELANLSDKLAPLIESLLSVANLKLHEPMLEAFRVEDEVNYDLESFFNSIRPRNDPKVSFQIDEFFAWYKDRLITCKTFGSKSTQGDRSYSGLSLFVPASVDHVNRYKYSPLYQHTAIGDVLSLILRNSQIVGI